MDLSLISLGDVLQIGSIVALGAYFKARTETRLDAILEQAIKTNGRLARAEDRLQDHGERISAIEASD